MSFTMPITCDSLLHLFRIFAKLGNAWRLSTQLSCREKLKDGLLSTVSAIDKFEQSVKDCLGI